MTVTIDRKELAKIAEEAAMAIHDGADLVDEYLLSAPNPVPYRTPVDAVASLLAELFEILIALTHDLDEGDEDESVRYALHSLMRLCVGVGIRLKMELGFNPASERAALCPDVEGEPWF